jgi:uncharacterized protein YcbK (DUF882 family)
MSKYFTEEEFKCNCGLCEGLPSEGIDQNLLDLLDDIRQRVGRPVYVLSGYRCDKWNAAVGGVPNSQHNANPLTASDITYDGIDVDTLAQIAEECGADGVGKYPSQLFVHVDIRSGRVGDDYRWDG